MASFRLTKNVCRYKRLIEWWFDKISIGSDECHLDVSFHSHYKQAKKLFLTNERSASDMYVLLRYSENQIYIKYIYVSQLYNTLLSYTYIVDYRCESYIDFVHTQFELVSPIYVY